MPIGEDLPMLVPIAIILTILVLFMVNIFIGMSEQNEITKMSQVSLNIADYSANILFSDKNGNLDYSELNRLGSKNTCKKLENLNISTQYNMVLNISDISTGEWWCWNNTKKHGSEFVLVNEIPFVITRNNSTDLGKVIVSASR